MQDVPYVARSEALNSWMEGHDCPPPPDTESHCQKAWDLSRVCVTSQALFDNAPDARSHARLLATCSSESGARLQALPSLGFQLSDKTTRVALELRLSTPLCRSHQCAHCRAEVDHLVTHGLSCCCSEGRCYRHAAVNDVIHRSLITDNIPSGLYKFDGKCPNGCSIIPWRSGKVLVWDATCSDTYAPSHLPTSATQAGAVVAQAERLKLANYAHLDSSHSFMPFAVEIQCSNPKGSTII